MGVLSCAILQGSIINNQKIFLIKFEGHSTRKTDWPKKTENVITCYVKIIFRKFYGYIRNQCDLLYMLGKKKFENFTTVTRSEKNFSSTQCNDQIGNFKVMNFIT